jgi:hypothetical protein
MRSPVAELLADFGAAVRTLGIRWYLFGAQAALLYGAARLTADADVTVDVAGHATLDLVDTLVAAGFDLRVSDVADFVEKTRVLPLTHRATGMPIDVVLAGPGLEERFFERTVLHTIEGVPVPVARPEDLIVMKVLAGRGKDLEDAESILAANPDTIDTALIQDTLELLQRALDQSDLVPSFETLLARSRE